VWPFWSWPFWFVAVLDVTRHFLEITHFRKGFSCISRTNSPDGGTDIMTLVRRALAEVCTVETVPVLLVRFEMHAFYTLQSFSEPRRLEPMRSLSEPKRDEEYVILC